MSSLFFKSKYEKRNRIESLRESRIQGLINLKKCSREYAVRYIDYENHLITHYSLATLTGAGGFMMAKKYLTSLSATYAVVGKPHLLFPALTGSFALSYWAYNKLTSYYLNVFDRDISHSNLIDYAEKYKVKYDDNLDNWEEKIPLTPFERTKIKLEREMKKTDPEGQKMFRRMGKDKDDNYYIFGKVRNLENISLLPVEEVLNVRSPIELQLKIDSYLPTSENIKFNLKEIYNQIESYKYLVENTKNFRSIKDKFLGLPFMINRHMQYPEPTRGTWQYDIYESIFYEPYDNKINVPDSEEKINKFNYHLFLHPSIIKKFDTNSEEFDMYLRTLNVENKTQSQIRSEKREYFCRYILPILNICNNKEVGYDISHYINNKVLNHDYENYLYSQYSNQKEEALFREAEELNYMNKNQPFVERTQYHNIDKSRIGLKASELDELLNNPTKIKNVRNALEKKYPYYQSVDYLDKVKYARYRSGLIQTMLDNDIDKLPDNAKDWEELSELQNATKEPSEEEQAMLFRERDMPIFAEDQSNYPIPKQGFLFFYNHLIDWNDYQTQFPKSGFVSPKKNRFELYSDHMLLEEHKPYIRTFNNLVLYQQFFNYINPEVDKGNEELAEKIIKPSAREVYDYKDKLIDQEKELLKYLEDKTQTDTFNKSDDVTEDDLDQALFEASFNKLNFEDDEFKKLSRRNIKEMEYIFKAVGFDPFEQWNDEPVKRFIQPVHKYYTDKAQYNDPLYHLYSEVEHPIKLREYIKKWRSGTEMRIKMPYYPETKDAKKTFNYI